MKNWIKYSIVASLAICILGTRCIAMQPAPIMAVSALENETTISVYGEAEREVTPDEAKIRVSIQNLDMDPKVSKDATLTQFDKAINSLVQYGIDKDCISMDRFSTYPSYDYQNGQTLIGYYAVLDFCYNINNLADIQPTLDILNDNEVVVVDSITFSVSNEKDIYNELLTEAVQNANQKASKIAGNDTQLITTQICEENTYYCATLYRNVEASTTDTNLIGNVTIQAKVKVTYNL